MGESPHRIMVESPATTKSARYWYRFLADSVFVIHTAIVLTILIGWIWQATFWIHFAFLFGAAVFDVRYGYCFLTRWEFYFRNKADHRIHADHNYVTYYLEKVFGRHLHDGLLNVVIPVFFMTFLAIDCIYLGVLYYLDVPLF
jgi:hypothetical protein